MREEERGDEEMRALGEEMEIKKGKGEEGERGGEEEGRGKEGRKREGREEERGEAREQR